MGWPGYRLIWNATDLGEEQEWEGFWVEIEGTLIVSYFNKLIKYKAMNDFQGNKREGGIFFCSAWRLYGQTVSLLKERTVDLRTFKLQEV